MHKKGIKGYLFQKDTSGNYIITHQADIHDCRLNRIIGKRMIKGRKTEFEEIEIRDLKNNVFRCLIRRKDLTVSDIFSFIGFYENGTRSIQHHPYTDDLLDPSLLDDFNIVVLTYKHYYWGDRALCDLYNPVLKKDITPELIEKLKSRTLQAIEHQKHAEEMDLKRSSVPGLSWNKIERRTHA